MEGLHVESRKRVSGKVAYAREVLCGDGRVVCGSYVKQIA